MNSMKRRKDKTLKDELPRSVSAPYATGDQWRNNSRKNEEMEWKQKQHPVVDVTGDRSQIRCCKEQYYLGTWNVRSMNQGKLEVVKQEMARVKISILGVRELSWMWWPLHLLLWGGVPQKKRSILAVHRRVQNAKRTEYLCSFPRQPFIITVIQVSAPSTNAKDAEVEWFYEDLQDLLELTPKKDALFIIGD